ncbi:hypothetical protein BG011_008329 [Mortierella polycephala]|uniref:CHCH domain-containing protein n=1 Tax=Mortierella polycephala TaxID=41804 RepID=A0A9P6TX57_9FUNG|nr:hypothetical protein BG011_008329 [Mortierella polycephala]
MTAPTQSTQQPQDQDPEWAPIPRAHTQYQRRPSATPPKDGQGGANDGKAGQGKEGDEEEEDEDEDEEEDEYEKRIERTGCAAENEALQMCYAEKHDWRACQTEMTAFRECWKRNGNVEVEK